MRRRSVVECLQQETELLVGFLVAHPEDIKDPLLDVPAMNTDRSAPDLIPVTHEVVGPSEGLGWRRLERIDPVRVRTRERMVDRRPSGRATR